MLEFRILGPLEAVDEDRPLALGGPRQRALLAILLLHRREVVSSDRLIDELWGDRPPATAAKTLQGYVSHLRKALGDGLLVTRGGGYLLEVAPGQLDIERFDGSVAEARRALADGDPARARELLDSALALWRGEPLADLAYEPFARSEIARLAEARLAALEDRIEVDLRLGRQRELVGELEALVSAHPHRERLLGQLMLALYRCGRHADALEAYRRGREALADELGLDPGPELRELERRILNHDPTLESPRRERSPAPAPERLSRARGRVLIVAGGALLLAGAIAALVVALRGGGGGAPHVAPNSVAVIDARTGHVVGQAPVGARPGALTFAGGSLWVANLDDQTVSRVDPGTFRTLRTLSLDGPPTGIAAAGGGVWVATSEGGAPSVSVDRIDPQFDSLERTARIANIAAGTSAAVAAHGAALWVAPYSGDLTRLDPQTGRVVKRLDPNAGPAGIALGAGGVWVTDSEGNNVTRVDPSGPVTSVAVGHGPSGIAIGDRSVWVADTGDNAVVRIDPSTAAVTGTIPVGEAPVGVTVGAGSVWVANSGDGTVTRIDPRRDKAIATIAVGGSPHAVVVAGGRAWVTVAAPALPAGKVAAGGTARVYAGADVDFMDPALAYSFAWQILYATCAKLLNYPDRPEPVASRLIPEVAQSLPARSPDGRRYTFTIRKGFRFSPPSNAPVTAQTFKDTIERTLNPRMRNPVAAEFDDVVGARAYMAGKAAHISGITVRGNKLSIRLLAPAPDLLPRLAQPFYCAVPSGTPVDPKGVRLIPSAGPYSVTSYAPGQGIVLTRNPNYHGSRPHRLERIEVAVGIPGRRAVRDVLAGRADYAIDGEVTAADAGMLAARYGRGSRAAREGRQQYFVNPLRNLDFLALNTHRPLFSDPRLRRAVNYAIDRSALARLGSDDSPLPEPPFDHYLPPGVPGSTSMHVYPSTPNLRKARRLAAGHGGETAVLYTCNEPICRQQAQLIKADLARIGLGLEVRTFPGGILYAKFLQRGEPFDLGYVNWVADYPDPAALLNLLLESGTVLPTFNDARYRDRLAAAARLSGTRRYLTYGRLNADLAGRGAPWVAWGNAASHDLFSARMGCQTYGVYGMDLAALCVRKGQ